MSRMKSLLGALVLLTAFSAAPNAYANTCAPGTGVAGVACLHYLAAGSSAMYQGFGITVANEVAPLAGAGLSVHHYTFSSANPPGELAAVLHDSRTGLKGTTINDEPAKLWVVFTCTSASHVACTAGTATDVWAYFQVDSTVGVRTIMSRDVNPGADCPGGTSCTGVKAALDPNTKTTVAATNQISPSLFLDGDASGAASCGGANTCDDPELPAEVFAAINNRPFTVGATDIRFEDGKYATKRATAPTNNTAGLGYGTVGSQLVGTAIQSEFSHTTATPVEFGLPGGGDPISSQGVPTTLVSFPVGESPIVMIANRQNTSGLGAPVAGSSPALPAFADVQDNVVGGVSPNALSNLFSGNDCAGDNTTFQDSAGMASLTAAGVANFPIHIVQRESLSGTYNTFEFTEIRTNNTFNLNGNGGHPMACTQGTGAEGGTQECGVDPLNNPGGLHNPLNLTCFSGGGTRQRAVGTGELVNNVKAIHDGFGYTFFSFGNVKTLSNSNLYGYLTIDQVDPIFANYAGGDPGQPAGVVGPCSGVVPCLPGTLPACNPAGNACNAAAIWAGGNSFPHLRDGSYRSWSLLRQVCDTTDPNCLASSDPLGAQAIITYGTNDIHTGTDNPTTDYLPIQDITYIRSHFNYVQFSGTEHAIPFVHFADVVASTPAGVLKLDIPATAGEVLPTGPGTVPNPIVGQPAIPVVNPGQYAQGGDAGGCIIPVAGSGGNNALTVYPQITSDITNAATHVTKYADTPVIGPGFAVGDLVSVYGFGVSNQGSYALPNAVCNDTNAVLGALFAPTFESEAASACQRDTAALQQFTVNALNPSPGFPFNVGNNPEGPTVSTAPTSAFAVATNGVVNCFQ